MAGKTSSAPVVNQELIDASEAAFRVVHEKAIAHDDARIARADFQHTHRTTYKDFKNLGIERSRPIVAEYK